jgi:hypothetical protein
MIAILRQVGEEGHDRIAMLGKTCEDAVTDLACEKNQEG